LRYFQAEFVLNLNPQALQQAHPLAFPPKLSEKVFFSVSLPPVNQPKNDLGKTFFNIFSR